MLKLKALMEQHGISIAALATVVDISRSAMSQIVNNNVWPKTTPREVISQRLEGFLTSRGVEPAGCLNEEAPDRCSDRAPVTHEVQLNEGIDMILRKQRLSAHAKAHFGLTRDPFSDDPSTPEDVFLTQNMREILADMESAAVNGRFIAVCGESGAGKTTLRELLESNLKKYGSEVKIIKPYILGMEDNDKKGKTLRVAHIEEAIIRTLDPSAKIKSSSEGRGKQVHDLLIDAGCPCSLWIEEAHSLPIPTLKHFKRLRELKDGQRQLLGVLLIGQPELADKLGTGKKEVREVVQRCELTFLRHLDKSLAGYVEHRFQRAGQGSAGRIFEPAALDAFAEKLNDVSQQAVRQGDNTRIIKNVTPMLYPLVVGNLSIKALNFAAELGMPKITADLIKEL